MHHRTQIHAFRGFSEQPTRLLFLAHRVGMHKASKEHLAVGCSNVNTIVARVLTLACRSNAVSVSNAKCGLEQTQTVTK